MPSYPTKISFKHSNYKLASNQTRMDLPLANSDGARTAASQQTTIAQLIDSPSVPINAN